MATSGEDSFSDSEQPHDFDLKKLANRLSISSLLSETSSNNSAGEDTLPFERVGASSASASAASTSAKPKSEAASPQLAVSTPKAKSRYFSRADKNEEDEARTPTLLSASQRPSSSAQPQYTATRSVSDPLDLLQNMKANQDSDWVEAKDHATLGRPFMEASSSRSSDVSLSSSIEDWSRQHRKVPTRSKTTGSPNPSSRRSSARFSSSSTSPILPYLMDEDPSSSRSTDEVPRSPLSVGSPKMGRTASISSQRTFSRSGSISKAPSLTRKHSRSVSRSSAANLTLPQLVRKLSGSSAGGDASGSSGKKRKAVSLEPQELFDVLLQHVEKAKKGDSRDRKSVV